MSAHVLVAANNGRTERKGHITLIPKTKQRQRVFVLIILYYGGLVLLPEFPRDIPFHFIGAISCVSHSGHKLNDGRDFAKQCLPVFSSI